jgi:glycosyltransferase involved in cell wall biosynthesis
MSHTRHLTLAALVPYPPGSAPSQRFRLEQWAPHLARDGIQVTFLPFVDARLMARLHRPGDALWKAGLTFAALLRRAVEATRAATFDAVVVHRAACLVGPAILERVVAAWRPLVFDFDDAIWLLDALPANQSVAWLKWPQKTETLCALADQVTAGNAHLAAWARRHTPHVAVVPSSVDTARYRPRKRAANREVVVGWMGSATSQRHLEAAAPVLADVVTRPGVVLRVVSPTPPALPGIPFEWQRWSAEGEIAALAGFDIGIVPMPDDAWNRGKCATTALQYMGMGIATVASPVGANRQVIAHGDDGLLAATPAEWRACLDALVADPALRARLGGAARQTVEARYAMTTAAAAFARATRSAVTRRRDRHAA